MALIPSMTQEKKLDTLEHNSIFSDDTFCNVSNIFKDGIHTSLSMVEDIYTKDVNGKKLTVKSSQDEITDISLEWRNISWVTESIKNFPSDFHRVLSKYSSVISISHIEENTDFRYNSLDEVFSFIISCLEQILWECSDEEEKRRVTDSVMRSLFSFMWCASVVYNIDDTQEYEKIVKYFFDKAEDFWEHNLKRLSQVIMYDYWWMLLWDREFIFNKVVFWVEEIDDLSQDDLYVKFRENYIEARRKGKFYKSVFSHFCYIVSRRNEGFLQYWSCQIWGCDFVLPFSYDVINTSTTLHDFQEKAAWVITQWYLKLLKKYHSQWYNQFSLSKDSINVLQTNKDMFDEFSLEWIEKLFYGFVRFFLVHRGIELPKIDTLVKWESCWYLFTENESDSKFFLEDIVKKLDFAQSCWLPNKELQNKILALEGKEPSVYDLESIVHIASWDKSTKWTKKVFVDGRGSKKVSYDSYRHDELSQSIDKFGNSCENAKEYILFLVNEFWEWVSCNLEWDLFNSLLLYFQNYLYSFSEDDLIEIFDAITSISNSMLSYLFATEFHLYPVVFKIIFFWKEDISHLSFEDMFYTFRSKLSEPKVFHILEKLTWISKVYRGSYNSNYWSIGFFLFSFSKDKDFAKIQNFDDFLEVLYYQLLDEWYIFFQNDGDFVLSKEFTSQWSFVKWMIQTHINKFLSSNEDKIALFLWSNSDFGEEKLLAYYSDFFDDLPLISKENSVFQKEVFLKTFSSVIQKSTKGFYEIGGWYNHVWSTNSKWSLDDVSKSLFKGLKWFDFIRDLRKDLHSGRKKMRNLNGWFEWYFPIWWKIHFNEPLSEDKVSDLYSIFGFSGTPFKLLHANTSLNLPACSSPLQLIEIFYRLQALWILEGEDIEAQLSIPWRLPNFLSWVLWSAMVFLKNYQVRYPKESFHTWDWNDLTDTCMMCYDAWVLYKEGFPVLWDNVSGRTDILWIKRIEEVFTYFILWNLVSQSHHGWRYSQVGKDFVDRYIHLLQTNNIDHILENKWVHNPSIPHKEQGSYTEHAQTIDTATGILNADIWRALRTGRREWFIFDVRNIIKELLDDNRMLPQSYWELQKLHKSIPFLT